MGKEVWATFSVNDHNLDNAFINELMLYDRLVIPVPPDDNEVNRWIDKGWDPGKQEKIIEILGDKAHTVEWDQYHQENWRNQFESNKFLMEQTPDYAFESSRTVLTQGLPTHVRGVQTIMNYNSIDTLNQDFNLTKIDQFKDKSNNEFTTTRDY